MAEFQESYFQDEVRDGFKIEGMMKRAWAAQIEVLEIIDDICRRYGLVYYADWGTLLGAVRHKGFIPWDDDIDICMPRPDYDKLIELSKSKLISEEYEVRAIELKNTKYPFTKIINKNIVVQSKSKEDKNLWIDVFPIDGISDDERKAKEQIKKITMCKQIEYLKNTKCFDIIKENKSKLNKVKKILLKPFAIILSQRIISKKMIKISKENDYLKTKRLGAYIWGYGEKEILDRSAFEKSIELKFENINISAPIGYHEYLSSIYGDYMKLPPKKKQIQHSIIAYKKI